MGLGRVTCLTIKPEWWERATAVASQPHHRYAADQQRLIKGLVAELAVVEHLLDLSDDAVSWLAGDPALRRRGTAHPVDIIWRGHKLDVKLVSRYDDEVAVKQGAQDVAHILVQWVRPDAVLEILGVLMKDQPETRQPAIPLVNARTSLKYTYFHKGQTFPVTGWWVSKSRCQPVRNLLEMTP